jgi:spore coat polysaccharide biosynthesis predicted glycosyltransferase SpsG
MLSSDIAITSAGRTVFELAALNVPMIVICQNIRETTHTFASNKNGVLNLGYRNKLLEGDILKSFKKLTEDVSVRHSMVEKMRELNFDKGKSRVISAIKSLIIS